MSRTIQTLEHSRNLLRKYGASQGQGNQIQDKYLNAQAERVANLVQKLKNRDAVVLGDPTGTGKTPVAIAAALLARDKYNIETILIITPNEQVAKIWEKRARFFSDNNNEIEVERWEGKRNEILWKGNGRIVITTLYYLRKRAESIPRPPRPDSVLIIVDEAHRGGYSTPDAPAHTALSTIASNARLLLVTATPFQIDVKAMTTMLELSNAQRNNKLIKDIHNHGLAINELLNKCRNIKEDASLPKEVEEAIQEVIKHKSDAKKALETFILQGFDANANVYGIKKMPIHKQNLIELDDKQNLAHNVARCLPELSGELIGRSMVQRELVSSSEAFWESAPIQSLTGVYASLCRELKKRLGVKNEHPKVKATCDWIVKKHNEGRHVLVFCVFLKTRDTIASALETMLSNKKSLHAPTGNLSDDIRDRFRKEVKKEGKESPLVLIVTDRFSESIDLDGGNPCIVHYDLPWNPARLRQRLGRVVRISSNFMVPEPDDIYIPILNVEIDRRQYNTVKGREEMGEHLLMGIDGSEPDDPGKDRWLVPDAVLKRLCE